MYNIYKFIYIIYINLYRLHKTLQKANTDKYNIFSVLILRQRFKSNRNQYVIANSRSEHLSRTTVNTNLTFEQSETACNF